MIYIFKHQVGQLHGSNPSIVENNLHENVCIKYLFGVNSNKPDFMNNDGLCAFCKG